MSYFHKTKVEIWANWDVWVVRKFFGNFDKNVNFGLKLHFLAKNRLKTHMDCGVVRKLTKRLSLSGRRPGPRFTSGYYTLQNSWSARNCGEKVFLYIFFYKVDRSSLSWTNENIINSRVDNIILCRIVGVPEIVEKKPFFIYFL